jgi:hypothetical protein
MPEWEADDEFADVKSYAWIVLTDAMLKSIMTNYPGRGVVLTSTTAISSMMESRGWLMDDVGGDGLSRCLCLSVLNISDVVLKQLLCLLWLRWDKRIGSTLWKHLKAARVALKHETRYNGSLPSGGSQGHGGLKRCKAAREHAMLMHASEVRKQSLAWVEEA